MNSKESCRCKPLQCTESRIHRPLGGTINLYDDEGNPIDYRIELESGEGFAFGADLQINTGELKFTIGEPCELLDLLFFDLKRSV